MGKEWFLYVVTDIGVHRLKLDIRKLRNGNRIPKLNQPPPVEFEDLELLSPDGTFYGQLAKPPPLSLLFFKELPRPPDYCVRQDFCCLVFKFLRTAVSACSFYVVLSGFCLS
ncbi:uncharacterized protein LOC121049984 [Rosa chinensis]|uniref:uncharacterized protein LOC121049984 n=1 Tax=Rosa chinensis TaxID=74649 RepID=UPI001AD8BD7E|nr:uncharacterized protein LOC121049984 [Rosa chinensis]